MLLSAFNPCNSSDLHFIFKTSVASELIYTLFPFYDGFQMLILHHARGNVEILSIIPRSLFLSVNPTGVGLRFSANYLRGAAGAWTVKGMR